MEERNRNLKDILLLNKLYRWVILFVFIMLGLILLENEYHFIEAGDDTLITSLFKIGIGIWSGVFLFIIILIFITVYKDVQDY